MPSKEAIIDNIEQYEAQELVSYIKSGIVTFRELCDETDGYFPAPVRREVQRLLEGSMEEDWKAALRNDTEDSYNAFINAYPRSIHVEEAHSAISRLHRMKENVNRQTLWATVDKSDIDALRSFIRENPADSHCNEARKLINAIQEEQFLGFDVDALTNRINSIQTDKSVNDPDAAIFREIINALNRKKISRGDLLGIISRDKNFLRASVVRKLITEGYLEYSDLTSIGIDSRFIKHLARGESRQRFNLPRELDKINKKSTEVYFWGIPASGKSCALGAVLSVAGNGSIARSMAKDNDCQGYGYMTRLAQLFNSDGNVGTLPEGTSIYSTYEMGFDLEDQNGATHPITCIDLAGELVRCMYKSDAGEDMSEDEIKALDTLTRILIDNRTVNRKIHFFVLEYGGEKRKYEGLSQTEYLDAALRYIERTNIFKTETDAIYLMLTKVDKAGAVGQKLVDILSDYIDENYRGFYQGLQRICRECDINGGKVERIPFSLGEVCFQDYCLFNEAPAANVVKKLLIRSKGFRNGRLERGFNFLRR